MEVETNGRHFWFVDLTSTEEEAKLALVDFLISKVRDGQTYHFRDAPSIEQFRDLDRNTIYKAYCRVSHAKPDEGQE